MAGASSASAVAVRLSSAEEIVCDVVVNLSDEILGTPRPEGIPGVPQANYGYSSTGVGGARDCVVQQRHYARRFAELETRKSEIAADDAALRKIPRIGTGELAVDQLLVSDLRVTVLKRADTFESCKSIRSEAARPSGLLADQLAGVAKCLACVVGMPIRAQASA